MPRSIHSGPFKALFYLKDRGRRVRVSTMLGQNDHQVHTAAHHGPNESRPALIVFGIHICSFLERLKGQEKKGAADRHVDHDDAVVLMLLMMVMRLMVTSESF